MQDYQNDTNIRKTPSPSISWKHRVWRLLRIDTRITVKVYRGFGTAERITIIGQVFRVSPIPRRKFRNNFLVNTLALLRLFIVKPIRDAYIELQWQGQVIKGHSERDGFFRLEFKPETPPSPGWHDISVKLLRKKRRRRRREVTGKGSFFVPFVTQYALISDIDDTFLISHSSTLLKRLYVLFTENARSRQPFDGVVKHYQLLSLAGTNEEHPNPFFYVSSSEWNLYDYIVEFAHDNQLPKGVYLLSQLKMFFELFKTGQNKHKTKFFRIVRIMESFPKQRFILLGDDTQEDPAIYASVVEHFPQQVVCVYIRQVRKEKKPLAIDSIQRIEAKGIRCCYFTHSNQAMQHSVSIGLVTQSEKAGIVSDRLHPEIEKDES